MGIIMRNSIMYGGNGSGGSGVTILHGSAYPSNAIGQDGQIYLQALAETYIKNKTGQVFDTGYSPNENTVIEAVFCIDANQTTSWPHLFGVRDSSGSDSGSFLFCFASSQNNYTNGLVTLGTSKTNISGKGSSGLRDSKTKIRMSFNSIIYEDLSTGTIDSYELNHPASLTAQPHLGIFGLLTNNGTLQSWSTLNYTRLYYLTITENDSVVHAFIPALDSNNIACLYDTVTDSYIYVNTGTVDAVINEQGHETIVGAYIKANGSWHKLLSSDIFDVNTGGS